MATELSLTAASTLEAITAFQRQARRRFARERHATPVGWSLRHARTLRIIGQDYAFATASQTPQILAGLHQLMSTPSAARLERLELHLVAADFDGRPWRTLASELPASCATVELDLYRRDPAERIGPILSALPAQTRRLVLPFGPGAEQFVDDRFDEVELLQPYDEARLLEALARTSRVRLCLAHVASLARLQPFAGRVLAGAPGDARFVGPDPARPVVVLRRPSLIQQQKIFGPVPVRIWMARALRESYWLHSPGPGRLESKQEPTYNTRCFIGRDANGRFTIGYAAERQVFALNGVALESAGVRELVDGDRLTVGGVEWVFSVGE